MFNKINRLDILEFSRLFSDVYNPIQLELDFNLRTQSSKKNSNEPRVKLWDRNKCNIFSEKLQTRVIDNLYRKLVTIETENNFNQQMQILL